MLTCALSFQFFWVMPFGLNRTVPFVRWSSRKEPQVVFDARGESVTGRKASGAVG